MVSWHSTVFLPGVPSVHFLRLYGHLFIIEMKHRYNLVIHVIVITSLNSLQAIFRTRHVQVSSGPLNIYDGMLQLAERQKKQPSRNPCLSHF